MILQKLVKTAYRYKEEDPYRLQFPFEVSIFAHFTKLLEERYSFKVTAQVLFHFCFHQSSTELPSLTIKLASLVVYYHPSIFLL